ncbi:tRNA epoxyqueuosine(34) reductase QueG [bacterium]|nr:tRNA epoxyqueuosine(34) reductase QueG [bacterium]
MEKNELTQKIRQIGLEIGFDKVGFAKVSELKEKPYFALWLEKNFNGKMEWMEKNFEKRVNPKILFPESLSVISVAVNYYTKKEREESSLKISRYAWGNDYHEVLKKKLKKFYLELKRLIPETEGRFFVDTAPISDKIWALNSGIGWIGKHSNVITKEFGSWVFLGELLVNLEFDYDEPIKNFCGSCTKCIDFCPTEAIVEPFVVDANKCISYLTIELKAENPIPEKFKDKIGNWIFGCDVCQDVCPWNIKFSKETKELEFREKEFLVNPKPEKILFLTKDEFEKIFETNAVKRTKFEGLLRNTRFLTE